MDIWLSANHFLGRLLKIMLITLNDLFLDVSTPIFYLLSVFKLLPTFRNIIFVAKI